jgi:hypothetical protein
MLGTSLTIGLLIGAMVAVLASCCVSYLPRLDNPLSARLRQSATPLMLCLMAGVCAVLGFKTLLIDPFTGTSFLLMLVCVAAYSLFVGVAISLLGQAPAAPKVEPQPAAKPKVRTMPIVLMPDGKPQIVVTRMKRGLPPHLPNTSGGGAAVPAPKADAAK